ncbi:type II toxin-antitoxin system VapC family toxin [Sphaerotilus sp.]|uniref:type II toxin-antitoxin system VapC family toxin n=1 Tax=Sphaerotilus sp. TaxID=2093942 RepID=UPI002ACD7275|nr:type II toxin-antitoxin system VapC family toxin [Sphaerotilus sp.]MDZ7855843.1 type II toxin-antitoxin system VapC family toxin [Sphaerotilus sp.]
MRYLLDANAVIAALNEPAGLVSVRLRALVPADVGVSAVVMHELYFGAYKSQRRERNMALVDALRFEVLPLDTEDARHAGEIRAWLAAQGTPIGAYDLLIAGQARARGLVLVTRNLREFERVPGLVSENWHEAPAP